MKLRGEWKCWFEIQHSENQDCGIWFHHFLANRKGTSGNSEIFYFGGLQNHCRWWLQQFNLKTFTSWKKNYDQHTQHIKKQKHYFANKHLSSQGYGFPSSHVCMWALHYKESWAPKNRCCAWIWTVVLEKTLESPLDCKEFQPVHPKGNQSWIFIGRAMLKLKLQYFGHLMWRTGSFEKTLMWERLKAGGEGDDRGWDGWMASLTRWTWVWVSSGSL